MAMGSAIASVAGGIMKMGAANKQAKAGQQAAGMSEEQMRMQEEQMNMQQEQYDNAIKQWEEQGGYAKEFESMLKGLGEEYGALASDMWQDWESTFGGMEQNLTDYYNNLDPTKYSTQAKANIGKEMQKANQQFEQAAAQSGIYTSGMKLQNQRENQYKQAEAFAQTDLAAEDYVMQQKNQFYSQYGAPQKMQAQNAQANALAQQGNFANMGYNAGAYANQGLANAYGNSAQGYGQNAHMYGNNANTYANSASGYGAAAGQNMGAGMNMFGSGISSMFGGGDMMSLF